MLLTDHSADMETPDICRNIFVKTMPVSIAERLITVIT